AGENPNLYYLIAGITFVATLSVVSGLERGIVWLSNLNIALGTALLLFVFFAGPDTLHLLRSFVQNTGDYLQSLITLTFWNAAYKQDASWQKNWTLFYWAWWISWAPFVGIFVARISRGRTIREFILGVLLVPTLLTFFWLTVFGNTALYMDLREGIDLTSIVSETTRIPEALYVVLEHMPLSTVTSLVATIVIASYFVTSSDSGSLVIDIITAGGHQDPPLAQRLFWALMEGAVAAVLLFAGGLSALQTAAITTALPMTIVLIFVCWGLVRALRDEKFDYRHHPRPRDLDADEKQ
ncbi:MAG: BCCT family transporter, partial [Leptospiraceae bacterium]|nr:BCCT family transporter [Leptospiraceae bacterium]